MGSSWVRAGGNDNKHEKATACLVIDVGFAIISRIGQPAAARVPSVSPHLLAQVQYTIRIEIVKPGPDGEPVPVFEACMQPVIEPALISEGKESFNLLDTIDCINRLAAPVLRTV